jgi:hypothetical protein
MRIATSVGELHARLKGVERSRIRARHSRIAAGAASRNQRSGDKNRDLGAHLAISAVGPADHLSHDARQPRSGVSPQ